MTKAEDSKFFSDSLFYTQLINRDTNAKPNNNNPQTIQQ